MAVNCRALLVQRQPAIVVHAPEERVCLLPELDHLIDRIRWSAEAAVAAAKRSRPLSVLLSLAKKSGFKTPQGRALLPVGGEGVGITCGHTPSGSVSPFSLWLCNFWRTQGGDQRPLQHLAYVIQVNLSADGWSSSLSYSRRRRWCCDGGALFRVTQIFDNVAQPVPCRTT